MKLAVSVSALFFLIGCGSSDDSSMVTEGEHSGSGSIESAFNGYILKSTSVDFYGISPSSFLSFYTYDSNNRTITRSKTPEITEEGSIESTMTLTTAGMPDVVTALADPDISSVETYRYNSSGRLLSRYLIVEPNGWEQLLEYDYNDSGQPVAERSIQPTTGDLTAQSTYEYNSGGLVQTAEYYLHGQATYQTIQFQHDSLGRVSGYSSVNTLIEGGNTSRTYIWDENNNIIQIENFNESGELTRSLNFEYVETEDAVYNSILHEYIYGLAFQ